MSGFQFQMTNDISNQVLSGTLTLKQLTEEQKVIFETNSQHICDELIKILGYFLIEKKQ